MAATPPWFRFYVETFGDFKVKRLSPTQRWIWAAVMGAARKSPAPGALFVHEGVAMTHQELAEFAGVKVKDVEQALLAMQRLGMVALVEEVIVVCNWESRQPEEYTSAERTRRYRRRHTGSVTDTVTVTSQPRHRDGHRDALDIEEETEKKTSSSTRGTRMTSDWKPSEADIVWQRTEKITDFVAKRETAKFRDYWLAIPGARGVKLDWSATWRNWMRKAGEDTKPVGASSAPSTFGGW